MINPVNGHLLIEPQTHDTFIASQKDTYEEIGVVVAIDPFFLEPHSAFPVKEGDKIYFDAWLAAKYPKEGGKDDEFYWLVKWEDVRAIEHAQPQ